MRLSTVLGKHVLLITCRDIMLTEKDQVECLRLKQRLKVLLRAGIATP